MSVYVLVNISNNKITFIEFVCFSDKCFVMPPRSKRVIKTRTIRQVLLEYMETVSVMCFRLSLPVRVIRLSVALCTDCRR